MRHHINLLREFSVPLLLGVITALVWANYNAGNYQQFLDQHLIGGYSFHFITNDIFMVLFFGIAAVEITKSTLPGGDLNPVTKAANPLIATLGGVLGPISVYLLLNYIIGSSELSRGWGIPTATDIALAWLGARAVFGATHPAVSYLLLLAVADDAIGLVIITVFYPNPQLPFEPIWLLATASGILVSWLLRTIKVNSYWPYLLLGGSLSWVGLYQSHLHPALALVCIIPFFPHATHTGQHLFEEENGRKLSALGAFERDWKVIVDFGLFLFGLANAGVTFSTVGTATWLVLAALILGKTAGIYTFGRIAHLCGLHLPKGMNCSALFTAGVVAGTGFTVALFVTGEAFTDPLMNGAAKMGAMLSICATLLAFCIARILGLQRTT